MPMGKKSKQGLGRSLIKDRFGATRGKKKVDNNSMLHTTEINDGYEWGRLNLQSVTAESSLQEFLSTAQLAGTEFTAEKLNLNYVNTGPVEAVVKIVDSKRNAEHPLTIPRRPAWVPGVTASEQDLKEKDSFLEWRRNLVALQEKEGVALTPYERNLELWRQLWRTLEKSDLLLILLDARNPLLFRCEDLEKAAKENNSQCVLLLNKADLIDEVERKLWAEYFGKKGIRIAFFSAAINSTDKSGDLSDIKETEHESDEGHDESDTEEESDDDDDDSKGENGENENEVISESAEVKIKNISINKSANDDSPESSNDKLSVKKEDEHVQNCADNVKLAVETQDTITDVNIEETSAIVVNVEKPTIDNSTNDDISDNVKLTAESQDTISDVDTKVTSEIVVNIEKPTIDNSTNDDVSDNVKLTAESQGTIIDVNTKETSEIVLNIEKPTIDNSTNDDVPDNIKLTAESQDTITDVDTKETSEIVVNTKRPTIDDTTNNAAPESKEKSLEEIPQMLINNSSDVLDRVKLIAMLKSIPVDELKNPPHLTVGLIGYPNVGKSSTVNILMQTKKVSVSAMPGHTRHVQSLVLDDLLLLDCPGLVLPTYAVTPDLLLTAVLPIDQMTAHEGAVQRLIDLVGRETFRIRYGLLLPDQTGPFLPTHLLSAHAFNRGFMTATGRPDESRSARLLLKQAASGQLKWCQLPPGTIKPVNSSKSNTSSGRKPTPLEARLVQGWSTAAEDLDRKFFANSTGAAHTKGILTPGVSGVNVPAAYGAAPTEKPWKQHNKHANKNKKEKLRKTYWQLDKH